MKISLQNIDFTGPLDLLLELIKKNRYEKIGEKFNTINGITSIKNYFKKNLGIA